MAVLNEALVDSAHVVARAIQYHARQVDPTSLSSGISSAAATAASTITSAIASGTRSPESSSTPSPTDTSNPGGGGDQNQGTNNPLLFFVALGFGVVFTNLW